MSYRDENRFHRKNGTGHIGRKYKCPHCGHGLAINAPKFLIECGKCKKLITEEQLKTK